MESSINTDNMRCKVISFAGARTHYNVLNVLAGRRISPYTSCSANTSFAWRRKWQWNSHGRTQSKHQTEELSKINTMWNDGNGEKGDVSIRMYFILLNTYWCTVRYVTDFVDSHERIDYMLIQLRRLCMDTGPMYDCMFYPMNQSDDNRMLCVHNETKAKTKKKEEILMHQLRRSLQQQCVYFIEIIWISKKGKCQ